jgi:hypothetical protein
MSSSVRDRIAEMRAISADTEALHHGMCSSVIDRAECDCYVSSYAVWADYIESALGTSTEKP